MKGRSLVVLRQGVRGVAELPLPTPNDYPLVGPDYKQGLYASSSLHINIKQNFYIVNVKFSTFYWFFYCIFCTHIAVFDVMGGGVVGINCYIKHVNKHIKKTLFVHR